MKRAVAAIVTVFLLTAAPVSAALPPRTSVHDSLLSCAIVAQARLLGQEPWRIVPADARICALYRASLR
jgi:hypothetical protein